MARGNNEWNRVSDLLIACDVACDAAMVRYSSRSARVSEATRIATWIVVDVKEREQRFIDATIDNLLPEEEPAN